MSEESLPVLVSLEERTVDFYGDAIGVVIIEVEDQAQLYVPLRPLCNFLGLAWSGQFERVQRDPVLSDVLRFVRVPPKNQGGDQELLALPLEYLPGWLFGISVSRVHPQLHAALRRYRKECFRVLAAHFPETLLTSMLVSDEITSTFGVSGIVYIAYGDGYYKIGTSRNVTKRIRAFNVSLPFQLTLIHTIDTDDALLLERRLHRLYRAAGRHVNGEWLKLTGSDVEALKTIPSPLVSSQLDEVMHSLTLVSNEKELSYEQ